MESEHTKTTDSTACELVLQGMQGAPAEAKGTVAVMIVNVMQSLLLPQLGVLLSLFSVSVLFGGWGGFTTSFHPGGFLQTSQYVWVLFLASRML